MTTLCSSREDCVAFDKDSPECQKEQGCFTEENLRNYLDWCRRAIECDIASRSEGGMVE